MSSGGLGIVRYVIPDVGKICDLISSCYKYITSWYSPALIKRRFRDMFENKGNSNEIIKLLFAALTCCELDCQHLPHRYLYATEMISPICCKLEDILTVDWNWVTSVAAIKISPEGWKPLFSH